MLSPKMLNQSLVRRNTLRDRSHHEARRPTLAVIFNSSEEENSTKIDNATLYLTTGAQERSRSASARRKSAPNLEIADEEERRRLEMQHQAALDLDFFVTNNNEAFVLLPAVDSKSGKMMLNFENFSRTQSVKHGSPNGKHSPRRPSVVGGVFDISPRNSMGDIKKLRKESMLPQQNSRKESNEVEIRSHQYTEDPTLAWEMLKVKRPVKLVRQMKQSTPIRPDHVRFVCVACTHGAVLDPSQIPMGDVLLIAGDFTSCGLPKEVKAFNENIGHFKHSFKIVIGGNHECTFDDAFLKSSGRDSGEAKELALKHALMAALNSSKVSSPKALLSNCIYLQDSMIELFGLRIYGTPWQPRMDNWAFNLERGQPLLDKWNQIPVGVDVLLTHTPPLGHGDLLLTGMRAGCVELLNSVTKRIRPKYHVFGHIHEGYGCTSDGYTKFINCCLTNHRLEMVNSPVIFDIPVNPDTKALYIQNSKKILKKLKK
uniref:Metallophos domain-containing protein n=1 Tax=Steinernema glaseri TaxID=37863 RepID=A0A1I7YQS0_9BILA